MTNQEMIDYLNRDGDLRVPCSRYGSSTFTVSVVAAAAAVAYLEAAPLEGEMTDLLDQLMGLAVNDHDDIEYLIENYGTTGVTVAAW